MTTERLNISLPYEVLANLIKAGALCAADFRCLDQNTKRRVWQICLTSCKQRIHCQHQSCQDCDFNNQKVADDVGYDVNDYNSLVKIFATTK